LGSKEEAERVLMLKGELDVFDVVIGQAKRQKRDVKDR
jgi:hypothetical protein